MAATNNVYKSTITIKAEDFSQTFKNIKKDSTVTQILNFVQAVNTLQTKLYKNIYKTTYGILSE